MDENEMVRRALGAWFRYGGMDQPANSSGVRTHQKKKYVVLENIRGILAVYRIKPDGYLKRLKRWPAEIEY